MMRIQDPRRSRRPGSRQSPNMKHQGFVATASRSTTHTFKATVLITASVQRLASSMTLVHVRFVSALVTKLLFSPMWWRWSPKRGWWNILWLRRRCLFQKRLLPISKLERKSARMPGGGRCVKVTPRRFVMAKCPSWPRQQWRNPLIITPPTPRPGALWLIHQVVKPGSILLRRWRYLFAVFVLISFFNTDRHLLIVI